MATRSELKTRFTPGPWETYYDGATFVIVSGVNSDYVGSAIEEPEARLIAAAPELYEALSRLADYARDSADPVSLKLAIREADLAIAKVRCDSTQTKDR